MTTKVYYVIQYPVKYNRNNDFVWRDCIGKYSSLEEVKKELENFGAYNKDFSWLLNHPESKYRIMKVEAVYSEVKI